MNLQERLDRLERFGEEIQREAAERTSGSTNRILALREDFNEECIATARAICLDPHIRINHEVFAAMQGALETLRSRMVSHQMRWNADRIEQNPGAYFAASQSVQDLLRDFVTNSRVFLRD
ncbi:hypothetical protein [Aurantiacibacter gilvus]|uniref:Uncharacterized protein n=1 Tax=Aurantiacibacter gilvus TaxID=3139141 RepID=A0ABU9I9H5_9SPHN